MREYVGPTRQATYIAFVPGNPPRLAAVAHVDVHIAATYLWQLDRAEPTVLSWERPPDYSEPLLSASPDGRWLASGANEQPRCWDLAAGPPGEPATLDRPGLLVAQFTGAIGSLTAVSRVATGGGEVAFEFRVGTVPVAGRQPGATDEDLTTLPVSPELTARLARMSAGDWRLKSVLSADGTRLAVAPREQPDRPLAREAFLWDLGTGRPPRRIESSGHPCALSFSPDGSRLVIDVGTIYVYDTTTCEVAGSWKAKWYDAPGLAWSPDGRLLARTDNSTTVRVYEVATGREVLAVGGKRGRLTSVAFSPDGLMLATGTHTGSIRVWDVE